MHALQRLRSFWQAIGRRGAFEREMDDEMRFHLERRMQDLMRNGLTRSDAARQARLEFGNPEAWQDRCRESRGLLLVDALRRDLRFGWRSLRKNFLLSATIVCTLALGTGANTAMFSVLHSILNPVSYPDADRLVFLNGRVTLPDHRSRIMAWSYLKFLDLAESTTSFESMVAAGGMDVNLTSAGEAERIRGEIVSPSFFSTLGVRPRLGSLHLPDSTSDTPHAVLAESLWRRRFTADPAIAGRTVDLNGISFMIAGVAPASFRGETGPAEVWLPLATTPLLANNPTRLRERTAHWLTVLARLRPGITLVQADQDLKRAVARMEAAQASDTSSSRGQTVWDGIVTPLVQAKIDPGIRRTLTILLVAVACVLLIASLNIASMLLGRGVVRRREVAVRLAIGASRPTIVRQFLIESLLLAAIGGALGFAVAAGGLRLLTALGFSVPASAGVPFVRSLDLQLVTVGAPGVVAYGILIAGLASLVFGLAPALQASHVDIVDTLKGNRTGWLAGRRRAGASTLRRGLLITQIALAVVLLSSAGLMIRTFDRVLAARTGIDHENVLTFRLDLPALQYTPERSLQLLEDLTSRLQALPGVRVASVAGGLPLMGQMERTTAAIDGTKLPAEAGINMVGPAYFEALQIPLVRGRRLTDSDNRTSPRVAVISETAARNYAPNGDVLGRRLTLGLNGWGAPGGAEIVGVVGDVRSRNLTEPFGTDIYLSAGQRPPSRAFFVVRTDADPEALVPAIRSRVAELDRTLPVYAVRTLSEVLDDATAGPRSTSMLLTLFSGVALLLASVGLYGSLAYSVTSRTREIGVRMALGADRRNVAGLVGRELAIVGITGLVAGLIAAQLAARALSGLLYGVAPSDPVTLTAVILVLTGAACASGFLPVRRASRISPLVALREDR